MDPVLCRTLNHMSLEQVSSYLRININDINKLYKELLDDSEFLGEINSQIKQVRRIYQKGIFKHEQLDSVDWFAIQRIILYILIRYYRPAVCLETGVFYGGTTCFILNALRRNKYGKLISIDLPGHTIDDSKRHHLVMDSEYIPQGLDVGFLVPETLKQSWTLIKDDSHKEIPKVNEKIDFYSHDSEHSFDFIKTEMALVWDKLSPNALVMADDLTWSNGFFSFCVDKKLFPLLITDNGKSGLQVRIGLVQLSHPSHSKSDIVG